MKNERPTHQRGHHPLRDSEMSLEEGLEEYWRVNPGLDDPRQLFDDADSAACASSRPWHHGLASRGAA